MARTAVIAGTATAVSGRVARRQNARWSEQEQQQYAQEQQAQPQQAYTPPPPPPEDDDMVQLQKLATLRDQGILTEEEFAAKKKQILGI